MTNADRSQSLAEFDRSYESERVPRRRARRDRSAPASIRSGSPARSSPLPVGRTSLCAAPTRAQPQDPLRAPPRRRGEAAASAVQLPERESAHEPATDRRRACARRRLQAHVHPSGTSSSSPPAPVEIEDDLARACASPAHRLRRRPAHDHGHRRHAGRAGPPRHAALLARAAPRERQDIELTFALTTSDDGDSALTVPPPLRGTRVHADDELRDRDARVRSVAGRADAARARAAARPAAWTRCTRKSRAR